MRLLVTGLVLLLGAGCQTLKPRCPPDEVGAACDPAQAAGVFGPAAGAACAPGPKFAQDTRPCPPQIIQHHHHYPPPQPTCPPSEKCPPKKGQEKEAPQQPKPGPPEEQPAAKQAIVTQDIMLIPRMVYVPYAPQVPVAPARLGLVAPGALAAERELPREAPKEVPKEGPTQPREGPKEAPCDTRDKQICDTLDRCALMLDALNRRLTALESRVPVPCGPAAAPACGPTTVRRTLFGRLIPGGCEPAAPVAPPVAVPAPAIPPAPWVPPIPPVPSVE